MVVLMILMVIVIEMAMVLLLLMMMTRLVPMTQLNSEMIGETFDTKCQCK